MQATVTPAPDAEPLPGGGQNAGVSGTTHAVVHDGGAGASAPAAGGTRGGRRLRRIRYAHSADDEAAVPSVPGPPSAEPPTVPLPAVPPPAAARVPDSATPPDGLPLGSAPTSATVRPATGPPAAPVTGLPAAGMVVPGTVLSGQDTAGDELGDYEGTAGPAYEAPRHAYDEFPDDPAAPARNDGLEIFGGVAATEPPEDDTPSREPDHRSARPDAPEAGPVWNQPIAPPPMASSGADDRKRNPFGRIRGLRPGDGQPAEDGGPRVSVRELPPDVQLRFIRDRVIIAAAVGLVSFLLWRNWAVSVTLVIIAWVLDVVRRQRTAVLYVNGGAHPGARKATSKQLRRMRRHGYFTLDARPIPDSREVIDHLVIGPTGVYAIDSEKWNPKLPIRTLNGKKLYLGPESQKGRLEHAVWEASQASEILSHALGYEVKVRPALAIYGPKVPWDIATIRNVDVFTGSALGKYLKARGRARDGVARLTREEVRTIYDAAARELPDVAQAYTPVGS